jgi:prevent-host-death family protein
MEISGRGDRISTCDSYVPKVREINGLYVCLVLAKIANMGKQISASDAKNNFGGLLDDVAALGRVDIMKHGRLVAVVLSPRVLSGLLGEAEQPARVVRWGEKHMIPPERARAARMIRPPLGFDEE